MGITSRVSFSAHDPWLTELLAGGFRELVQHSNHLEVTHMNVLPWNERERALSALACGMSGLEVN